MKVLFGLGNPGTEYTGTRHNAGYLAVDTFARVHNRTFSEKTKLRAYVSETVISGEKVLIAKPTTFYNEVGISARSIIDFYKLEPARDFLVIHDDLALPFGTIRVRKKGSDAGNKGIKSLNAYIGADYSRLRIGIGVPDRTNDDSSFVLSRFSTDEMSTLKAQILPKLCTLMMTFIEDELSETSYRL